MTSEVLKDGHTLIAYGQGSKKLATGISESLGIPLMKQKIGEYPDGETFVTIEENVRDKNVIFVGSSPNARSGLKPNDVIMEYVYAGDALVRSRAARFNFFIPYLPYARMDRTKGERVALTSQRAIDTIMQTNPHGVMLAEPHEERLELAFPSNNPPEFLWFTNLFAANVAAAAKKMEMDESRLVSVAVDHGTKVRVTQMTKLLRNVYDTNAHPEYAAIDKNRRDATSVDLMSFTGGDYVRGALALLPDDILASGSTMVQAAQACKDAGAAATLAIASHALLTRGEDGKIKLQKELDNPDSPIDGFIVTNTLYVPKSIRNHPKVWVIDAAEYAALAIHNAWGVPYPGIQNGQTGSLRTFNQGGREPLTPQAMPRAMQQHLIQKLAGRLAA